MKLWLPQQTLFLPLLTLPLGPRLQPSTETFSHAFFLSFFLLFCLAIPFKGNV